MVKCGLDCRGDKRGSPESLQVKQWQDMTQGMSVELVPAESSHTGAVPQQQRTERGECLEGITTEGSVFLGFLL